MSSSPSGAMTVVSGNGSGRRRRRPDGSRYRTRRWTGRALSAPTHAAIGTQLRPPSTGSASRQDVLP
jgi:hypothetical protein